MDAQEKKELLPSWFDHYYVIGDIPGSSNYYLLVTQGSESGSVYEFEHDGFEFRKLANNFSAFIDYISSMDTGKLTAIARHIRFAETDSPMVQWWIKEYQYGDNELIPNEHAG